MNIVSLSLRRAGLLTAAVTLIASLAACRTTAPEPAATSLALAAETVAPVTGAAAVATKQRPTVYVPASRLPILVDGRADEAAWLDAPTIWPMQLADTPPFYPTAVRLLHDEEALYLAYHVDDTDIRATYTEHDARLWEDGDCVELFLVPPGEGAPKIEIQVNPLGAFLDIRHPRNESPPAPSLDERIRWDWPGATCAVTVDGTLNDDRRDRGWTVEVRLPWHDIGVARDAGAWTFLVTTVDRVVLDPQREGRQLLSWPSLAKPGFHREAGYGQFICVPARDSQQMPYEGFSHILTGENGRWGALYSDYRGYSAVWAMDQQKPNQTLRWQTAPVAADHVGPASFAWIMQCQRTANKSEDPHAYTLYVDGQLALRFEPCVNQNATWTQDEVQLAFTYNGSEWKPSGIYRLTIPADRVHPGQPLTLELRHAKINPEWLMLKAYTDTALHNYHTDQTSRQAIHGND